MPRYTVETRRRVFCRVEVEAESWEHAGRLVQSGSAALPPADAWETLGKDFCRVYEEGELEARQASLLAQTSADLPDEHEVIVAWRTDCEEEHEHAFPLGHLRAAVNQKRAELGLAPSSDLSADLGLLGESLSEVEDDGVLPEIYDRGVFAVSHRDDGQP